MVFLEIDKANTRRFQSQKVPHQQNIKTHNNLKIVLKLNQFFVLMKLVKYNYLISTSFNTNWHYIEVSFIVSSLFITLLISMNLVNTLNLRI